MSGKVKREYILENLCCANCAAKIERKVGRIDGVESSLLDFVSKKLIIEINNMDELERVFAETASIIKVIEPDVNIKEVTQKRTREASIKGTLINEANKKKILQFSIGCLFFLSALLLKSSRPLEFTMFFISYVLIGKEVLLTAFNNIRRGEVFDENFLMALATVGAFAIGQFPEGVAVMIFYSIGEFLQDMAVDRSRRSISSLMDIRPDYANLVKENNTEKVHPEEVRPGDYIIVKPGEKVPLDGIIADGSSMVDTSALTGESVPREVETGDSVIGGFINRNGLLKIKVQKSYEESTLSKILELVENASSRKAVTENFITKFAHYYTPSIVAIGAALAVLPPLFISGANFHEWLYKSLIFIVVSCPCALVISIPLSFFGGIGGASRNGILVKGSNYLEALNNIGIVVFDKTGTLTRGVFKLTKMNPVDGVKPEELLYYAAHAEYFSTHPIAKSILNSFSFEPDQSSIKKFEELPGLGIKAVIGERNIYAGNYKLMEKLGMRYKKAEEYGTIVYVSMDGTFIGSLVISDEIKEDSGKAIRELKGMGIDKVVMLTGDNKEIGKKVAGELGVDEAYGELLPHEKVEKIEQLEKGKRRNSKLVFVGDGINDAPVLARADIGIAMGGLGSDAAIEAADIVIMNDEPYKIINAIKIARKTKSIVWQNIIFALGIKLIVQILGVMGKATLWEAVFADVGVALIAVLNSLRAMKIRDN